MLHRDLTKMFMLKLHCISFSSTALFLFCGPLIKECFISDQKINRLHPQYRHLHPQVTICARGLIVLPYLKTPGTLFLGPFMEPCSTAIKTVYQLNYICHRSS